MDSDSGEIRAGFDHSDELFVGVSVFVKSRHLHHEGRENLLFQDLFFDRELAFHQGVPLLETIHGLDIGLDVHFPVTYLGVVDVVLGRDDIDLVALPLPDFFRHGDGKTGHSLVLLAEALSETTEFKARLALLADF